MANKPILSGSVFLDTAYAIALASTTDALHQRALALADELEASGTRLVTTWAVLLEIGNALSRVQFRQAALELLSSLQSDPSVEIVPLGGPILEEAGSSIPTAPTRNGALQTACPLSLWRHAASAMLLPPTSISSRLDSGPCCVKVYDSPVGRFQWPSSIQRRPVF
jgi:hypothetical protein